jgi:hypothetical protein
MKKKIFILLLVLLFPVCLLFTGCGVKTVPNEKIGTEFKIGNISLIKVEQTENFVILVDKETKIMYLLYFSDAGSNWATTGLTIMLNSDGTPMLWDGEL